MDQHKVLGRGSYSVVYLCKLPQAENSSTEKCVAVKVIDRAALNEKLLRALNREIEIMSSLHHPNIVKFISYEEKQEGERSLLHITMEYCDIGDLASYVKRHRYENHLGGINEETIRHYLSQLAAALEFLRRNSLIHRDLKPQNILLQSAPTIDKADALPVLKLADFGFARRLYTHSMAETLCGSPLYMAPEILRYEKYDGKADLWSIGVILFEMICGRPPFSASNHLELLKKIQMAADRILFPDENSENISPIENSTNVNDNSNTNDNSFKATGTSYKYSASPSTLKSTVPHSYPYRSLAGHHSAVCQELRDITRALLKKDPAERISFEEFFMLTAKTTDSTYNKSNTTTEHSVSFPPRDILHGKHRLQMTRRRESSYSNEPPSSPDTYHTDTPNAESSSAPFAMDEELAGGEYCANGDADTAITRRRRPSFINTTSPRSARRHSDGLIIHHVPPALPPFALEVRDQRRNTLQSYNTNSARSYDHSWNGLYDLISIGFQGVGRWIWNVTSITTAPTRESNQQARITEGEEDDDGFVWVE